MIWMRQLAYRRTPTLSLLGNITAVEESTAVLGDAVYTSKVVSIDSEVGEDCYSGCWYYRRTKFKITPTSAYFSPQVQVVRTKIRKRIFREPIRTM